MSTTSTTRAEHLDVYAAGWMGADAAKILDGAAPGFVYDDPQVGVIGRDAFPTYFAELVRELDRQRGGPPDGALIELSHVVSEEAGSVLTAWAWWSFPGTGIEGSALIEVGDAGVASERIAYFSHPGR